MLDIAKMTRLPDGPHRYRALVDWFIQARDRDWVVYHVGTGFMGNGKNNVFQKVWDWVLMGKVKCFQMRTNDGIYFYVAMRSNTMTDYVFETVTKTCRRRAENERLGVAWN